MTPADADSIRDHVCKAYRKPAPLLAELADKGIETFTTGDAVLDQVLGGGYRTGMIWELTGESAAGKTQFALQASLFVQLPMELRGLCASACYLTTSSKLRTNRLLQIRDTHSALSSKNCGLSGIHTMATPTLPMLILALTVKFRDLIKQLREQNQRPVKLLVIDALTELFHSDKRTTTNTLVQRSKDLAQISALLHSIASEHQIAVLVLNEVVDVVDQGPSAGPADQNDLIYREQARWFNRADSIPGEDRKEAGLALVWANQVNARIMCTRTNRYRNLYDFADKRSRGDASASVSHREPASDSSTLIRRLSVIFSSVSSPASVDYIVTAAGIATVDEIVSMSSNICISKKRPAVLMEETAVPEAPSQGLTTQELPEELGEPDAQSDGGANSDDLYAELDLALLDAADAEDSVLS